MAFDPYKDLRGKPWFVNLDLTPTEMIILEPCHISDAGGMVVAGQIVTLPRWEADMYFKLGMAKFYAWPSECKAIFGPGETK